MVKTSVVICDHCGRQNDETDNHWELEYQGPITRTIAGEPAVPTGLRFRGRDVTEADICSECINVLSDEGSGEAYDPER